uniref:J domain-containing protein n=1 Tax=Hemiselmis tepida TaxID=464990 RepID=A0A7S0VZ46_9CRYP
MRLRFRIMSQGEPPKKKVDFYKVLGVPRGAGQEQIKSAYKRLALQCHPDKANGDPELMQQFQEVSAAYTVLMDPTKRKQYDMMGEAAVEMEALDMEQMTFGTTLVAALFSKLGAPIPTAIPQRTLDDATDTGARQNARAIVWGQSMECSIPKNGAQFYRGEVTGEVAERGVRVMAHSPAGSKFKVLWFDQAGTLEASDESVPGAYGRGGSMSCTHLCSFRAMHLDAAPQQGFRVSDEDDCPPIFRRLETLAASRHSPLREGNLLVAIQGDNFFRDVKVTVTFSLLDPSLKDKVTGSEEALAARRDELCQLEREYWDARQKYERVAAKVAAVTESVDDELLERDALYAEMAGDGLLISGVRDAKQRAADARARAKAKAEAKAERRR